uniref:Uncharacterized protein n=1 Tax=Mandrillus leucophaeus TaxID=9568 RepID=A0A2K5XJC4_MANLE
MVKFLLEKGADVNASDNYQRTALILAVSDEPTRLVKLLLQQGLRNMLISMVLLCKYPQFTASHGKKKHVK